MPTPPPSNSEFAFHPKFILLMVLLAGLTMLFLALTVGYVYIRVTRGVPPVRVPGLFWFNTLILLASSWSMIRARRAYLADETAAYLGHLQRTLWLSGLFMALQMLAWWLLFRDNVNLGTSTTSGFLYVISFTHLLHVVGGLPFLFLFYLTAKKRMVDPVTVLVYFSDSAKRLELRLLTVYWHFLDLLWIYLVVFFGVNVLI